MFRSAALWFLALAMPVLAQSPRPMTLVDTMSVPQISDPQLSPDGRTALFVRSDPDWKANKRITHIWKINADGSGLVQMTNGQDGENAPRWSPDGTTIAFVAKRGTDAEAAAQIQLMPVAGGEARALTTHATAVSNITWAPDGASLYFRAADAKSEEQKAREKAKDDVFAFDEDFQQQHLWNVVVGNKAERRITQGDYSVNGYELSRDGRRIAMHRAPSPLLGDSDQGEVWVMDAGGANARQITNNKVPEAGASLSPDGSQVLFLSQANERFEAYYNNKLFIAPAAGGEARVAMPGLPYEVESARWAKDGQSIYKLCGAPHNR